MCFTSSRTFWESLKTTSSRPEPLLPSLCRARKRAGHGCQKAFHKGCGRETDWAPRLQGLLLPGFWGNGFHHPAQEAWNWFLKNFPPTGESWIPTGTVLRLGTTGLCLPWQESEKSRVLEWGVVLSSAFHLRSKFIRTGGFLSRYSWLSAISVEKWKRERGSRHSPRVGTEYYFLPTCLFCHGVWVARASRCIMFQLRVWLDTISSYLGPWNCRIHTVALERTCHSFRKAENALKF